MNNLPENLIKDAREIVRIVIRLSIKLVSMRRRGRLDLSEAG